MEITIYSKHRKRLLLVEQLALELGLSISKSSASAESTNKRNGKKLYKLMKEKAETGGIKEIKDPIKWQREQRKDTPLHGRA